MACGCVNRPYSNGAYFWDGADIKPNYATHFKVRHGIKFTDPAHNIYDIKESTTTTVNLYKTTKKKVGGKVNRPGFGGGSNL